MNNNTVPKDIKVVGLTGGIGSGKTTVAKYLAELGVPVYMADEESKNLLNEDPALKEQIIEAFGSEAYENGQLNRKYLAATVFKDTEQLEKLNAIVHPAVFTHFDLWKNRQKSPWVVKEAAILIESGSYKSCDAIVLVVSNKNTRIQRVITRDQSSAEAVEDRINNQLSDDDKIPYADYVLLNNTTLEHLYEHTYELVKQLNLRFG
ncbi:MAG: dephospho-CoA kinase [Weeksellaceae bacterium]|nr:dephospho-CoA kinase [Weeksellaceae bacterium]